MDYKELLEKMAKQKDEMTNSERMVAYAKGEEVDRIPYTLIGPDTATSFYGYTMGEYRRSIDVQCDVIEKLENEFGEVGIGVALGLKKIGEAVGSKVEYPETNFDYVSDHILKDYKMLDYMDIVNPYKNKILSEMLEEFKYLKEHYPNMPAGTGIAGPLSTAISIRKPEDVLRDIFKDKENLHKLLDFSVQCSLAWVAAVCKEIGPVSVSLADPFTSTSVINKSQFEEFSEPHLKDLIEGTKKITGEMPSIHICGKSKGIWDNITDLGLKSFSIDNCEDLEELKNCVGNKVPIVGNVPPVEVLRYGTIDDVIESVKDCIAKASDSPLGYTLAAGCQVPLGTPKENMYAYVYAARKYGRGAQKGKLCKGLFE